MAFGPPFGRRACIAMTLGEMDALPDLIPSLRETGFFVGGFNPVSDWLVSPLVMVGLRLAPRRLLRPLARLQFWSMARFARPPYGTVLQLSLIHIFSSTTKPNMASGCARPLRSISPQDVYKRQHL